MADYTHAEIPTRLTGLRACLRCALIKEFSQFYENGCENCDFLNMLGNSDRIYAVSILISNMNIDVHQ